MHKMFIHSLLDEIQKHAVNPTRNALIWGGALGSVFFLLLVTKNTVKLKVTAYITVSHNDDVT